MPARSLPIFAARRTTEQRSARVRRCRPGLHALPAWQPTLQQREVQSLLLREFADHLHTHWGNPPITINKKIAHDARLLLFMRHRPRELRRTRFEMVSEDDAASPRQATMVAQHLVDAPVAGIVGHWNSGTTIPASAIYAEAGIPQISPSATNLAYTRQGFKTVFRNIANHTVHRQALGHFAVYQVQGGVASHENVSGW